MSFQITRRDFISISAAGFALGADALPVLATQDPLAFKLSLNESSLDRSLKAKKIDHLDFPKIAKDRFGIDAVEYVTSYFSENATKEKYLKKMNRRAAEQGVRQILIVIDDAGSLIDSDAKKRKTAMKNHRPWIDLAKTLGCHSVCVKLAGEGPAQEQLERGIDSLAELAEYAKKRRIHVLVCCEGGKSCKPQILLDLLDAVDSRNLGLYPSFTGFDTEDPYRPLKELMPFAKGVAANAKAFDEEGNETSIDFQRMVKIVLDAGYRGYVSIHYQGKKMDEMSGIRATKKLLQRTLSAEMKRNPS